MAEPKRVERPLSPFMIGPYYRPQITSISSILTRITGNALIVAVVLAVYMISYALHRKKTPLVVSFALLCVSVFIYTFGALMEFNSYTLEQMLFWHQVQYFAMRFLPTLWLLLWVYFAELIPRRVPAWIAGLFVFPLATFVVRLTNGRHALFYRGAMVNTVGQLRILRLAQGPWYLVLSFYSLLCFLVALGIYLLWLKKAPPEQRPGFHMFLVYLGEIAPSAS